MIVGSEYENNISITMDSEILKNGKLALEGKIYYTGKKNKALKIYLGLTSNYIMIYQDDKWKLFTPKSFEMDLNVNGKITFTSGNYDISITNRKLERYLIPHKENRSRSLRRLTELLE